MPASKHTAALNTLLSQRSGPRSLDQVLKSGQPVMIYGAGNCGRGVQRTLLNHGIVPECFLDTRMARGSLIQDVPVSHPDADIPPEKRAQAHVIIAIFNRNTNIVPIMEFLSGLGYRHLTTFLEFHRCCPAELGDRFWLTSPDFYDTRHREVQDSLELWHDEKSRALYVSMLSMRVNADCACALPEKTDNIYFDNDFPQWKTPMTFIDCGSFDGNTLVALKKHYGTVQTIIAFEPDDRNFTKLSGLIKSDSSFADKTVLYPCGVWSHTTQLNFNSESTESSHLCSDGRHRIQCIALDETLHGFEPTLIKMDIEGAEPEALAGAANMVRKSRPALAISVYHRPEHLWAIPLLIKQWELDYSLYLRIYGYSGFDAVLYALPR
jgi:FkbM family methyltransferase